ncbi:hypothetical protein [Methylobacterium indicum]|nr:hypothetical protein [Methylobacterium indicum]
MEDDVLRATLAKAIAASAAVEALATTVLMMYPPEVRSAALKLMRGAMSDIGPKGTASFEAAEFMADVRVLAVEHLDKSVSRIEAALARADTFG